MIKAPDTLEELLAKAATKLGLANPTTVYLDSGAILDDAELIEKDDVLFVAENNAPFYKFAPAQPATPPPSQPPTQPPNAGGGGVEKPKIVVPVRGPPEVAVLVDRKDKGKDVDEDDDPDIRNPNDTTTTTTAATTATTATTAPTATTATTATTTNNNTTTTATTAPQVTEPMAPPPRKVVEAKTAAMEKAEAVAELLNASRKAVQAAATYESLAAKVVAEREEQLTLLQRHAADINSMQEIARAQAIRSSEIPSETTQGGSSSGGGSAGSSGGGGGGGGGGMDVDQILMIIGGKYPRKVVECVIRHGPPHVESIINLLLQGIDVEDWLARDEALMLAAKTPPSVFDCGICFCEYTMDEMYTVDCPASHRFCFECIRRMITMNVRESAAPVCPDADCGHALSELEVTQVMTEDENGAAIIQRYKDQTLQRGITSIEGAIPCPTPDCTGYEIASTPGIKERVTCSVCRATFCSLCKNTYHYNVDCEQIPGLERTWMEWLTVGRGQYLEELSAADAAFEEQLNEFNEVREAHEREVQAALARLRENEEDEAWKAANCRRCPSCDRVVNKVAGCDSMVCGRNYHGGDQQNGCGASFNWQNANPYVAASASHIQVEPDLDVEAPEHSIRTEHFLIEGVRLRCDLCQQDIFGPSFKCVACPAFTVCLRCQPRVVADTSPHSGHVFDVIMDDRV